jgi:hypothetical protein
MTMSLILDSNAMRRLAVLLPVSALLFLVWPTWSAWFAVDDTAVILCAQYETLDLLIDRPTANFCNPLFFTPLWPILFKLDSSIWGLHPEGYRLVNFILATSALALLWALLRPRLGREAAWIAVMLLAVSMPLAFGVGWITRRHYLMGLMLAMLAVWLFQRFIERPEQAQRGLGYAWLYGSVVAYFLAILSKEAYAFVPAVVFLLANHGLRRRLWLVLPYALALGLYLLWRGWMLGGLGGYPMTDLSLTSLLARGWDQLSSLPEALFGPAAPLLLVPVVVLMFTHPRQGLFILIAILISLSPYLLYPGTDFNYANKAFSASAIVAAGCGMAWLNSATFARLRALLGLSLVGLVLGAGSTSVSAVQRAAVMGEQFHARYQAIYSSPVSPVLVLGDFPYYFTSMNRLHSLLETGQERDLDAVSSSLALPLFADRPYERVVLQNGRFFDGDEARRFLSEELAAQQARQQLPPPDVKAVRTDRALLFESIIGGDEHLMRCLIRVNYANCAEVKPRYLTPYPTREPIISIDFHRMSRDQSSIPIRIFPDALQVES